MTLKRILHIGVLALQGDFAAHIQKLRALGAEATEVRKSSDLEGIDALIIHGGESTTNAKLEAVASDIDSRTTNHSAAAERTTIFDAIKQKATNGLPIWRTCMGSIVLAKNIEGSAQG